MRKRGCALILCIVLAMAAVGCGKYAGDAEKVKFTYSETSIFSTIDNFIQKDLVEDGKASSEWKITKEENEKIRKLFQEYDLVGLAEQAKQPKPDQETVFLSVPRFSWEFTFVMEGKTYTITSEDNVPDEFRDFLWRLTEILEDLDVYKALPEAKGGYL